MKRLIGLMTFAICAFSAASTHAATFGVVRGRVMYYNELGNFCPNTRACGSARYLQASFGQGLPVPNVKVIVQDNSNRQIGVGSTDADGYFIISWYSAWDATQGHFHWNGEHKDNRFFVRGGGGETWVWWTGDSAITHGTSSVNPQEWGTYTWGFNGGENAIAHAYAGAQRAWADSFTYSGLLGSTFVNKQVRAFNSSCGGSCAGGGVVILDTGADTPYAWSSRVAHEFGHLASEATSRDNERNPCYQYAFGGNDGWNSTSPEWGCSQYEEAFATWVGDVARYWWWNAASTDICGYQIGACGTMAEPSTVAQGITCATNESRWMQSIVKMLWDVYDDGDDSEWVREDYWKLVYNNYEFAVGTGNQQRDEWQSMPADFDGRGGWDYLMNYWTTRSVALTSPWYNNCAPPGD